MPDKSKRIAISNVCCIRFRSRGWQSRQTIKDSSRQPDTSNVFCISWCQNDTDKTIHEKANHAKMGREFRATRERRPSKMRQERKIQISFGVKNRIKQMWQNRYWVSKQILAKITPENIRSAKTGNILATWSPYISHYLGVHVSPVPFYSIHTHKLSSTTGGLFVIIGWSILVHDPGQTHWTNIYDCTES